MLNRLGYCLFDFGAAFRAYIKIAMGSRSCSPIDDIIIFIYYYDLGLNEMSRLVWVESIRIKFVMIIRTYSGFNKPQAKHYRWKESFGCYYVS
jgi:hypothetical protein